MAAGLSLPSCPLRESSQPQLSKSPRLQFRVSVYMTPAELMAWTKAVSLFAVKWEYKESRCEEAFIARPVLEITHTMQETVGRDLQWAVLCGVERRLYVPG